MGLADGSNFGPYRIVGPLGRGGMASVYKAYEPGLDRYVALKTLPREFLHDETFAERFEREAKRVAKLEHPNIVPIYAYGIEDGVPWMAMRLVAGGALSGLLKRGRLDPARTVAILKGSAAALTYAHSKNVVHRDVKPQNILLDEEERVYLADFGIAKMLEGEGKLTATGMISGTPQYMAPEQATANAVDGRADTYALGIVAYEMLTGRVPFAADTPVAVLMKHVQEPIPLPSPDEVREPLVRALLKALAKKPDDRWPTAVAFVAALEAALQEAPTAQALPTLALTRDVPTAPPQRTVSGAPPLPVAAPARSAPTAPARRPPHAPASPAARSLLLVGALAAGGVVVLGLAGGAAYWFLRQPAKEAVVPGSTLPQNVTVAGRGPAPAAAGDAARPNAPAPPAAAAAPPPASLDASAVQVPPATAAPVSPAPATITATPPPSRSALPPAATPPPATAPPAATLLPAPAGPSPEVRSLMNELAGGNADTRWKAAESLGNLGSEAAPAVPSLVSGLGDRAEDVRWRSAEALGKIGGREAVAPLAGALKDRSPLVRTEAAKALGVLGPKAKGAVADLGQALSDSEVYTRREAAKALVALAPESRAALSPLMAALKDKDKFVRLQSAKALGSLGPLAKDAAPALTAASKDGEPLVARAAAEALRRVAGDGTGS